MRKTKKLNNRELGLIGKSMRMYVKTHSDVYPDDFYSLMEKFLLMGFPESDINLIVEYFEHY